MGDALLTEVRFTERKGGYDPDEVDEFLRRVGRAITVLHGNLDGSDPIDVSLGDNDDDFAAELMTVRFATAKRGYDPDEVDSFMARVAEKIGILQTKLRVQVERGVSAAVSTASIFRVVVPVGSVEVATRFYSAVLEIEGERVSPGRHYFDCGGVILVCLDGKADGDGHKAHRPNPDHVYLAVQNLDAAFDRVREAGPSWLEDGPRSRPWGERSFYCGDPWGNPLCFVEEVTTFTGGTW
jgi:DivIVA domain-containing protein